VHNIKVFFQQDGVPSGMKRGASSARCSSFPAGIASQPEVQPPRGPSKLQSGPRPT